MGKPEKPLQSESPTNTGSVQLSGGFLKQMVLTAGEAVPTVLPLETAGWWAGQTSRLPVLTKAIKDVIHHPPTLRELLTSWRRFYAVMFGKELPNIPDTTWDLDQLADGYILFDKLLRAEGVLFKLHRQFPRIFCQTAESVFDREFKYIHDIGTSRNFRLYFIHIAYLEQGSHFELEGEGEGVLFEELLVQQLFVHWSGQPLAGNWLYANGSRTTENKVPAIQWRDGKILVRSFPRASFKKNLWHNRLVALEK